MAESAMVVDSPTPTASSLALLSAPPAPLPVVTTINSNGRIIPASTFIPKAILAAIATERRVCDKWEKWEEHEGLCSKHLNHYLQPLNNKF